MGCLAVPMALDAVVHQCNETSGNDGTIIRQVILSQEAVELTRKNYLLSNIFHTFI